MKFSDGILAGKIADDLDVSQDVADVMTQRYITALENINRRYEGYSPTIDAAQLHNLQTWVDRVFFFKGLPTVVYAKMGFGKSYFSSWLLLKAIWLHPDKWDFYTNLPFFWVDDKALENRYKPRSLFRPSKMSDLLISSADSILHGRMPAVLLDEMDSALLSQRWQSRQNMSWMQFTFVERHLKTRGPVLVYHNASDIPHYLRKRTLTNTIVKLAIRGGQRVVVSERNPNHELVVPADAPIIPYSTHGLMGFEIDVDMTRLGSKLHGSDIRTIATQIQDNIGDCLLTQAVGRELKRPASLEQQDEKGKALAVCDNCRRPWRTRSRSPYPKCPACGSKRSIIIPKEDWSKYEK